jgi:hypothetical protein
MAESAFRPFIRFSRRVLAGIDDQERTSRRYKWTLATITELLSVTHSILLGRLDQLATTTSLAKAQSTMSEITDQVLEESFRVEGLCDAFRGLGDALRGVNYRTRQDQAPGSRGTILTGADVDESQAMADVLASREAEVARLYVDEIRDIREVLDAEAAGAGDLTQVRARADAARQRLTDELAEFQLLAAAFRR